MAGEVTWLHISDFHFKGGDAYDRNVVLRALVAAVEHFRTQGRRPDLILATGDIAQGGQAEEYAHASVFFDKLLSAAALDKQRLFVVPGNHDVDRRWGRGLERTLASEDESVDFFGPDHPQPHFAKLAGFRAWYDEYFHAVRAFPARSTCFSPAAVDVRGVRVGILPLNSALFCADDHDHGKLWIGRRPLDEAVLRLEALDPAFAIALVHHPHDWLHDEERGNIVARLGGSIDFLLRGHLHENEAEAVVSPTGGMLRLAAGATYQTRTYPNRALFVSADQSGQVAVFPIRYEDRPHEVWTLDPSVFPKAPGYVGTFTVTLKRRPSGPSSGTAAPPAAPESGGSTDQAPRAYLSYSWDSPAHKARVLALANRLRHDGVASHLDQYQDPPEGWSQWQEEQVRSSDWVLLVCTDHYRERIESVVGSGVYRDGQAIQRRIQADRSARSRVVPVGFGRHRELRSAIPPFVGDVQYYDVTDDAEYGRLLARFHGEPAVPVPPVGRRSARG